MTNETVEELAERVHEAWIEKKALDGVSSRLAADGEELMVAYAQLSDNARELDRVTVRAVLTALAECGFSVDDLHERASVGGPPRAWARIAPQVHDDRPDR